MASLAAAVLVMILIVGPFPAPAQATSLLTNGSFETGSYSGSGGYERLTANTATATAISGWKVTAPATSNSVGTYWKSEDGSYSLDLSGGGSSRKE